MRARDGVGGMEEMEALPEFPAALMPQPPDDPADANVEDDDEESDSHTRPPSMPPPATVAGLEQQAVDELSALLAQLHKRK